jgi:hypothetical protein
MAVALHRCERGHEHAGALMIKLHGIAIGEREATRGSDRHGEAI